jgi:hypothetical protein
VQLTELADQLLSSGMVDVYEKTQEELKKMQVCWRHRWRR